MRAKLRPAPGLPWFWLNLSRRLCLDGTSRSRAIGEVAMRERSLARRHQRAAISAPRSAANLFGSSERHRG